MKTFTRFALITIALMITSCTQVAHPPKWENITIVGSGNLVSQSRPLSGFDKIDAGLTFDLTIRQDETFGIVVIADDNWVDFISTEVDGTTLILDYIDGYAYNVYNATTRVEVTMPVLAGLNINESSQARLDGFQAVESVEIVLTGSSFLGGELIAQNTDIAVFGSATIQLSGSSETLQLEGCGNSLTDLRDFQVENAALDMSCASTATVAVSEQLDVEASQNARVYYLGQPASGDTHAHEHAYVGQK